MIRRPPRSTRTDTLFPYTTLFRSEDDIPNMILLLLAAEALSVPFVASGGMADGRSLVAALALGADGVNMGTRFVATQDAPVHENVKRALVEATELDTRLVMRPLRNTERVLNNPGVEKIRQIEREKGDAIKIDDIFEQRSEEHTSELQSLMRISYAVFC